MSITVDDVADLFHPTPPIDAADTQQALLDMAERAADRIYGGRLSRLNYVEGDRDDFVRFLAAHYWVVASGGEAGSTSETGGSITYDHLQSSPESALTETRYGRLARSYLREQSGMGIVRHR